MVAAAMRIPSPVFAAVVCAGLCAAPPATAKPRPDLTIARVTTTVDGGTVRVAVDIRNRGSLARSSPPAREMCTMWETRG